MRAPRSLRWRLLAAGVLGVASAALVATFLLGAVFERAVEHALDRRLSDDLATLAGLAELDAAGRLGLSREPADERFARVFSGAYWQIVPGDGAPTLQSRSLWDESLPRPEPLPALGQRWHANATGPLGQPLRLLGQRLRLPRSDAPTLFLVASDRAEAMQDVGDFRWWVALSVALLATALLAVLGYQVSYGLRPLARLGETAARVRAGEDARFPEAGLPTEVAPLARHLNELLDHHGRTVQRARAAAQDLAHALKTPLAVLAAESERSGAVPPDIVAGQVRRMQASVDRHLAAGLGADPRQRTAVRPVAEALCGLMRRLHGPGAYRGSAAGAREPEAGSRPPLRFENRVAEGAVFAGAAEDLEEMLGNLLDNAGKWAASSVRIEGGVAGGRLEIEVADDGPGLPPQDLERVLARGVRLDQRAPGSGLGLSIAAAIAASYGGGLALANGAPGLRARLSLPAA